MLVVEPRRVACRSLARRVAELEGARLGDAVGYAVRDDVRCTDDTRIVFATPGLALRWLTSGRLDRFTTVVLDEFHERSLDLDLLLALLRERDQTLVVMSATLAAEDLAASLDGVHVHGEGRAFPVAVHWLPQGTVLPDPRGLESRVLAGVSLALEGDGDVLVFLPGKAEIRSVHAHLERHGPAEVELLALHGGLSPEEQDRAFSPGARRRVLLATNVAETSLTLPRIAAVVDSGLVRRTRYHRGRAHLALLPVARDAAEQRRGRAGRLRAGRCVRLWAEHAPLEPHTPPEVLRESLVPLVLGAHAAGRAPHALRFVDPPHDYALTDAVDTLTSLGALGRDGITEAGRLLFGLPLDPQLGRLLLQAREDGTLSDTVDLVAALACTRPLFRYRPEDPEDDLRHAGCDGVALVRAVRDGEPERHGLDRHTLSEARRNAQRLRQLFPCPERHGAPDRLALAATVLRANPGAAHVARRRKRHVGWSAGGTEVGLGRQSAVDAETTECLVALDELALGDGRDRQVLLTAAMPVSPRWLAHQGIGRERATEPSLQDGVLIARVERVHAGRVLHTEERPVTGASARQAVVALLRQRRLFSRVWPHHQEEQERVARWRQLHAAGLLVDRMGRSLFPDPPASLEDGEDWLLARLGELGLEQGDDLALLEADDLCARVVPEAVREALDADWPGTLELPDQRFAVHYKARSKEIVLEQTGGGRKDPPSRVYLPSWPGFTVIYQRHSRRIVLKG